MDYGVEATPEAINRQSWLLIKCTYVEELLAYVF
jgi:hypothetical protein